MIGRLPRWKWETHVPKHQDKTTRSQKDCHPDRQRESQKHVTPLGDSHSTWAGQPGGALKRSTQNMDTSKMKKKGHVPGTGKDGVRVSPDSPHRENRCGHLPNQLIDTGSEQSDDNATTCTSAQHRVSKQTRAKLPMLTTMYQATRWACTTARTTEGVKTQCTRPLEQPEAGGRQCTLIQKHRTHNVGHNHVLTGARLERGTWTQDSREHGTSMPRSETIILKIPNRRLVSG